MNFTIWGCQDSMMNFIVCIALRIEACVIKLQNISANKLAQKTKAAFTMKVPSFSYAIA